MTTVAAEDRATQECPRRQTQNRAFGDLDPSAAVTYTGQGRRDRRLFLLPVLAAQSAKLPPAPGGRLLTQSVALQIKMRPINAPAPFNSRASNSLHPMGG